jgi:hypothetical protein
MKNKIPFITCFLIMTGLSLPLVAQQNTTLRVAVFDPSAVGVDEGTRIVVREIISSVFVNTGKFSIVERSLLDQIMKEQAFTHSDAVDESQATRLGKLAGAHKVVLSVVTKADSQNMMLSIKIIDVQTATVEKQQTRVFAPNALLNEIEPLTQELLGERIIRSTQSNTRQLDFMFSGVNNKKNPAVKLYLDDHFIGEGSLNTGFRLNYPDTRPGKHRLRVEWSGVVPGETYRINTAKQTHFEFKFKETGFGGYVFILK